MLNLYPAQTLAVNNSQITVYSDDTDPALFYAMPDQPSIRMLAERLQIQHHSAVELVDRLVDRGLVLRSRAPTDRRQVLVQLTPRGEAELQKLAACHLAELRENGPALVDALEAVIRRTNGGN